jgi:hypothetical protein
VKVPFAVRGLDVDNDSAFINETLVDYGRDHKIELTRCRAYKKNDQAWIEQKNGAVIRRMVGYGRLEGAQRAAVLNKLYSSARLFVNFFQPSFKLLSKIREGAKVIKKYHAPATLCERLLERCFRGVQGTTPADVGGAGPGANAARDSRSTASAGAA